MSFNSALFLAFLFTVVLLNYLLPNKFRSLFLLFASCCFIAYYSWESLVTVLLAGLFNFVIAGFVAKNRNVFLTGIVVNVVAILLFNYFNSSHQLQFSAVHFELGDFIVALGLSYYSLQNISYLCELRAGRMKKEKDLCHYLLYCSFFPRMVCGPVMLPGEFLPQAKENEVTKEKLQQGFNRFLLGLFKKMVIADRLAPMVASVFDHGDTYSGLTTVTGFYLFTIQLYFDFSAYSDMAVGAGKMLGYDLKENFEMPLRSGSVSEFWRRWHISLISWFSKYLYYPIVYKLREHKKASVLIAILLTFLVSGIWHGIGFTFIAWSICHIVFLFFEFLTKGKRGGKFDSPIFKVLSVFLVFNLVCFSNVFFRADSMETALNLLQNASANFIPANWLSDFIAPLAQGGHQIEEFNLYISLFFVLIFLLFEKRINGWGMKKEITSFYVFCVLFLILLFGVFSSSERFIYMQF